MSTSALPTGLPALETWLMRPISMATELRTIPLRVRRVQWNDKSGNARHIANSNAANRPVLQNTGPGGIATVRFTTASTTDANADNLSNTFNYHAFGWSRGFTIFTISDLNGGVNQRLITNRTTTGTGGNWLLGYHGGAEKMCRTSIPGSPRRDRPLLVIPLQRRIRMCMARSSAAVPPEPMRATA